MLGIKELMENGMCELIRFEPINSFNKNSPNFIKKFPDEDITKEIYSQTKIKKPSSKNWPYESGKNFPWSNLLDNILSDTYKKTDTGSDDSFASFEKYLKLGDLLKAESDFFNKAPKSIDGNDNFNDLVGKYYKSGVDKKEQPDINDYVNKGRADNKISSSIEDIVNGNDFNLNFNLKDNKSLYFNIRRDNFSNISSEQAKTVNELFTGVYNKQIKKLTEDTAANGVGVCHNLVFKIYNNEDTVKKESMILNKFRGTTLHGLAMDNALDDLLNGDKQSYIRDENHKGRVNELIEKINAKDECENIEIKDGYISIGGIHVLLSRKIEDHELLEFMNNNPENIEKLKDQKDKYHFDLLKGRKKEFTEYSLEERFNFFPYKNMEMVDNQNRFSCKRRELESKYGLENGFLEFDSLTKRMYVLSELHGEFTRNFSSEEKELIDRYNQTQTPPYFDYNKIKNKVLGSTNDQKIIDTINDSSLEEIYENVVEKQKQLIEKRKNEGSLVFTHRDAKWDNWFSQDVLGDFGSSCFSTEYNDVAKSLIDLKDPANKDVIDCYVNMYYDFRKNNEAVKEDFNTFKRNVYEHLFTESLRLLYYKINNSDISNHLMKNISNYKSELENLRE